MTETIQRLGIIRADTGVIAKYSGGAIKRLNERAFEGHIIRWHDPQRLDLTGEWFSRRTYLMKNAGYPIVGAPINYQHGMQKDFGSLAIGLIKFTDEDEIGQFVRGELKTREDYIAMLQEIGRKADVRFTDPQLSQKSDLAIKAVDTLIASVPLQFSGGFDPSTWLVDPDSKHIDQSGVIHAAFTPTPADDLNPQIQFKSAWDEVLKYERTSSYSFPSIHTSDPHRREDGSADGHQPSRKDAAGVAGEEPPVPVNDGNLDHSVKKGVLTMDPEMIAAIAQQVAQTVLAGVAQMLQQEGQGEQQMPPESDVVASLTKQPCDPAMNQEDLAKALSEKAYKFVMGAVEARKSAKKSAAAVASDFLKRTLPAVDTLPAGGSSSKTRIDSVKDLRTAHLSAGDMALGLMTLRANAPKGMKFDDTQFVSVEYLKAMQSKAERELEKGTAFKDERNEAAVKAVMPRVKANELDATNIVGQGAEWAADWWSSQIIEVARANRVYKEVLARGVREEILGDGFDTAFFPTEGADPVPYVRNQANSVDSTGRPQVTVNINPFGTGNVSVTPSELSLASAFTTIEQEDSIIPIVKQLNYQFGEKMEETTEQALINGDVTTTASTNINIIDGTPGTGLSKPYYLLTDGWMKHALVTYSAQSRDGGAIDENDVRLTVKLMAKAIRNRKDRLIFLADSDTYNTMLDIVSIKTDEVRNRNSTLTTGNIESVFGYMVVESAFMELANSSGKVTAAVDGTLGRLLLVYPPYWGIAWKRKLTIENVYDPLSGTHVYVATMRMGMVARGTSAAAVSYNLTIA